MTPIANRNESMSLRPESVVVYDTTTGLPKVFDTPPNIVGQGVDVIALDF